jgi:hypothetical protein
MAVIALGACYSRILACMIIAMGCKEDSVLIAFSMKLITVFV